MEAVELKVDGMTCGSCVKNVTRALQGVPGVQAVEVNQDRGSATVRGQAIAAQAEALESALRAAGYQARLMGTAAGEAPAKRPQGGCGSAAGGCCCGH